MIFQREKIAIFHPGKCGGTTIEHLFLQELRQTTLSRLLKQPCFSQKNNKDLTPEYLQKRIQIMVGFIHKMYAVNGIFNIYLQHADIAATLRLHDKLTIDNLFKITFVRNPFPRILSAYYYNMWDRKLSFRQFVLDILPQKQPINSGYTRNHFGNLHHYTHLNGRLYVDFVGKLENIAADVASLNAQLGLSLDLQHERQHAQTVASSLYGHYSQAYDEQMVTTMNKIYAHDLDLFDYQFERKMDYKPQPFVVKTESIPTENINGHKAFMAAFRKLFSIDQA